MCGRFGIGNPERLDGFLFRRAFPGIGAMAPRFNITPSADIPIVLSVKGDIVTSAARWGLVPSWATDAGIGTKLVQARGETAHEKPAFRSALKSRRALIPADLFYEWQAIEGQKLQQPWCIRMKEEAPFAMAALWETWLSPDAINGEALVTCCVLTTSSNYALKHIHHRMPVILHPDLFEQWLDPKTKPEVVRDFIRPYPLDGLFGYQISTWVNSPAHNDVRCIEPIDGMSADAIAQITEDAKLQTGAKAKRVDNGQIDAFG
ncbi:MAG: SOS response-associated peptidase [Gemmatimonadaceae bacterium]